MTERRLLAVLGIGLLVWGALSIADTRADDDYERSVDARLRDSTSPRDWILAAEPTPLREANAEERAALMSKAAAAAPDDVLVQWIAMNALAPKTPEGAIRPDPARARRFAAMEPDNAAHWLPLLSVHVDAKDAAAIDETLAKMAAATRFDEHYRDHLLAWADVYRRFAAAPHDLAPLVISRLAFAPDADYPVLLRLCYSRQGGADLAPARRDNCSAVARRLTDARTILARVAGYVILSRIGRNTPEDDAANLDRQWLSEQWAAIVPWLVDAPGYSEWWLEEWRTTGVETTIMRRWLEREGHLTEPPPGWQPRRPAIPKA